MAARLLLIVVTIVLVFALSWGLVRTASTFGPYLYAISIIGIGLVLWFLAKSLRQIPADPPQIAVVTVFGRRTNRIKKEGYRFFPYPFVGAIPITMTEVIQELEPYQFIADDNSDMEIQVQVTWTPNEHHAVNFLNQGGAVGVKNTLQAMIREALRRWVASSGKTWEGVRRAENDVKELLIEAIAGVRDKESVMRISLGEGHQPIESLGITLNRLTLPKIDVRGERRTAKEQTIWTEALVATVMKLESLGLPRDKCIRIVQAYRGEARWNINEFDLSPEMIHAVAAVLGTFKR